VVLRIRVFFTLSEVDCFSVGYPKGVMATTFTRGGIPRISLIFFSLNPPIQQVPRPTSVAASIKCSKAIATSTV